MSKFWSPFVSEIEPYVPGEQPKAGSLIKLNTNENPYPPSPSVAELLHNFPVERLRLYPDPEASELKQALAKNLNVEAEQVFVGNGSDEVLGLAFMAFFKQAEPILFPAVTYSFYPVYCNLFDIQFQTIPLDEDFAISLEAYQRPNGGIIIANPNAPTGIAMPLAQVEALLQQNPDSLVIIDEAYVDFGGESAVALVDRYANLLVVQTFSKSRSLAGLRVGYAIGHPQLIEGLDRVKNSFNSYPLDALAIKAAVAAVNDQAYFQQRCEQIIQTREWLINQLQQLGFEVLPSAANFVFASPLLANASEIYQQLRERGILVRYFNKPGIDRFLRISVGTDEETQALIEALQAILTP